MGVVLSISVLSAIGIGLSFLSVMLIEKQLDAAELARIEAAEYEDSVIQTLSTEM